MTKRQLLDAVWGDAMVTEATLSQSIRELRKALGDDARNPKLIATVYRRGFRFLGAVDVVGAAEEALLDQPRRGASAPLVVGRDDALRSLRHAFSTACGGARRLVLVSGEPGMGKTTLATALVASLGSDVAVGRGEAMPEIGDVEPFFSILEAIRGLLRGPHRGVATGLLREYAPPWLQRSLGLHGFGRGPGGHEERGSSTQMLLKLLRAIEVLAREVPVVLVLEDLHWASQATVDLLNVLVRGAAPCRLLLVVTYRPSEAILQDGRLDQLRSRLSRDPRLVHLPLEPLSADDCDSFLRARFGGTAPPDGVAKLLHAHTEGNPLFLATAVDHLVERDWLLQADDRVSLSCSLDTVDAALPKSLIMLVEHETGRLAADEARVLEAASVAGVEFYVQEVAAALGTDEEEVERSLEALARSRRFVRRVGAELWPDDTRGSRWRFVHVVHRRALLDRVSAARLQRWHQRIGERLEAGWSARRETIVARLAMHFEASRDRARALEYLDEAALVAEQRSAPADAKNLLARALRQLGERTDDQGDRSRELAMRLRSVSAINAMEGYASDELREQLRRAIALCGDRGHERFRFRLTFALVASCLAANDPRAKDHLLDLRGQAEGLASPGSRVLCDALAAVVAIVEGRFREAASIERFVDAGIEIDQDLYVGSRFDVFVPVWSAIRCCAIGDAVDARRLVDQALSRSRNLPDRANEAFALYGAAQIAAWDRDRDRLEALALRSDVLTREYGYRHWGGLVRYFLRRLQVLQDDRPGAFDSLQSVVDELGIYDSPQRGAVCVGLAEAALQERRFGEGFAAIEAGLASLESGLARTAHSELLRVRASLRRAAGEAPAQVRADLEAALTVATEQGAGAYAKRVSAELSELTAGSSSDKAGPVGRMRVARGGRRG